MPTQSSSPFLHTGTETGADMLTTNISIISPPHGLQFGFIFVKGVNMGPKTWPESLTVHLSSLRRRSSRSWILFSSWATPAEERDWPSMSARRLRSSFSCSDTNNTGQNYPDDTGVKGQHGQLFLQRMLQMNAECHIVELPNIRCVCLFTCAYLSLHGVFVQL